MYFYARFKGYQFMCFKDRHYTKYNWTIIKQGNNVHKTKLKSFHNSFLERMFCFLISYMSWAGF